MVKSVLFEFPYIVLVLLTHPWTARDIAKFAGAYGTLSQAACTTELKDASINDGDICCTASNCWMRQVSSWGIYLSANCSSGPNSYEGVVGRHILDHGCVIG